MPYVNHNIYALWESVTNGIMPWKELSAYVFLYNMFDKELDISLKLSILVYKYYSAILHSLAFYSWVVT